MKRITIEQVIATGLVLAVFVLTLISLTVEKTQ